MNEKCISIGKLSRKLVIHRQTIYKHLNGGNISLICAKKYAQFFGVSIDDILGRK